jgi:ketosteroid isomerase-like protein
MSHENVEIVRRSTAAYNRRDLDGIVRAGRPTPCWTGQTLAGLRQAYIGHDEIREFARRFLEAWDEVRVEIVDGPAEVEGGRLITENVAYTRGRDGIEVQARSAWLITIRNGEQTSLTMYQTTQEALEAAGLEE